MVVIVCRYIGKLKAEVSKKIKGLIENFQRKILGYQCADEIGNNRRRALSRICLMLSLAIFGFATWDTFWALDESSQTQLPTILHWAAAICMMLLSLIFFSVNVLFMPFRHSKEFKVDTKRLLWDAIVSSIFTICAFSLFYRLLGTKPIGNALENIYFSAVTFSTLGYGDYAPLKFAKAIAATEAMLGNLHLGMIVGATFAALNTKQ